MTSDQGALPPLDLGGITDPAEVGKVLTAAVGRAFTAESATRMRRPNHLGLSAISGCTRRCAFAVAQVPASDTPGPGESRAANLGTWTHLGLLPRLAEQFGQAVSEREVTLNAAGLKLTGHIDLDLPMMVLDLKTVGEWRLQAVRGEGILPDHLMQVAAYGLARMQEGSGPAWLGVLYLDRASGDEEMIVIPFTNAHVVMVVDRVTEIRSWADEDPDQAPRRDASGAMLAGPGRTYRCDDCPWMRRCWGDDARPGIRVRREYDDAEVESMLLEYIQLNAVEGPAKRRKAEIAKDLESVRHGVYGPAQYRRGLDTMVDDPHAALVILRTLGYEVPQSPRRAPLSIRLTAKTTKARKNRKKEKDGE